MISVVNDPFFQSNSVNDDRIGVLFGMWVVAMLVALVWTKLGGSRRPAMLLLVLPLVALAVGVAIELKFPGVVDGTKIAGDGL